ncbi:hypothetical protein ADL12_06780 [Streptomyces regalis]|uniref:Uncharacterized protein n=1 Tax=Streptomyces regalis TaxID=68262 RepID=A0A0X3VGE8_9ACTN|nr:hypothetical protein ADL12_06780 [Streptomyces regalis]
MAVPGRVGSFLLLTSYTLGDEVVSEADEWCNPSCSHVPHEPQYRDGVVHGRRWLHQRSRASYHGFHKAHMALRLDEIGFQKSLSREGELWFAQGKVLHGVGQHLEHLIDRFAVGAVLHVHASANNG